MPEHHAAILFKDNNFAVIAFDLHAQIVNSDPPKTVHLVGSFDPRCRPGAYVRSYQDPTEAREAFLSNLAVSRDRGWTVVYNGSRNRG